MSHGVGRVFDIVNSPISSGTSRGSMAAPHAYKAARRGCASRGSPTRAGMRCESISTKGAVDLK